MQDDVFEGFGCNDEPTVEDRLQLKAYTKGLTSYIEKCPTPMTVAIQGDWGSGKTSALYAIKKELEDKEYLVVNFNTWQYSQFNLGDQLIFSLLTEILQKINAQLNSLESSQNNAFSEKAKKIKQIGKKVISFLTPLAKSTATFMGAGAVVQFADAAAEGLRQASESPDLAEDGQPNAIEALSELRDALQELVSTITNAADGEKSLTKRLFIFIDDLDRLEPVRAVEVMEALKVFLNITGCVFVLAIDFSVVANGVKAKYGKDFEESKARAFFDKIIQVPFNLPVSTYDITGLLTNGLKEIGLKPDNADAEAYEKFVRFSVGTNPRSIKRLINTFGLLTLVEAKKRETSAGEDGNEPTTQTGDGMSPDDPLGLFASLAFQTAYPQMFNSLMREIFKENTVNHDGAQNISQFFANAYELLTRSAEGDNSSGVLEEWDIRPEQRPEAVGFVKEFMQHFQIPEKNSKGGQLEVSQCRVAEVLGLAAVTAVGNAGLVDAAFNRKGAKLENLTMRLRNMPSKYSAVLPVLRAFDEELNKEFGGNILAGDTGNYWAYAAQEAEATIPPVGTSRFCEIHYSLTGIRVEYGRYLDEDKLKSYWEIAKEKGFSVRDFAINSNPPLALKDINSEHKARDAARFIASIYRRNHN